MAGRSALVARAVPSHLDEHSQTRIVAGTAATDWLARMSKAADRFSVDWPATRAVRALIEEAEQESVTTE